MTDIKKALTFLHVAELKNLGKQLKLSNFGNKMFLINKICAFVESKTILADPIIPPQSIGKKLSTEPLSPKKLILKGEYKNDLKNRLFFKKLIGDHFHFTAYGIDWINERWVNGNPPSYQEFAEYWQNEYVFRKNNFVPPKEEWAFINFSKDHLSINPTIPKNVILKLWQEARSKQKSLLKAKLFELGFTINF